MIGRWNALDRRLRFGLLGLPGLLVIAGAPVAWYLGSPLFIDATVDEDFPVAAAPAPRPASTGLAGTAVAAPRPDGAAAATVAATPTTIPSAAAGAAGRSPTAVAITTPAPGGVPAAVLTTTPAQGQPVATLTPSPPPATAALAATPAPTGPVALASGQFTDADSLHQGSGAATVFRLPGGGLILRLEDFRVTNGPDLYVYLSGHPAPRSTDQLHAAGDFEVARLKGNVGNQNYELPAELDLARFKSVVIYCKRFATVFSTAELAAARSGDDWGAAEEGTAARPGDGQSATAGRGALSAARRELYHSI